MCVKNEYKGVIKSNSHSKDSSQHGATHLHWCESEVTPLSLWSYISLLPEWQESPSYSFPLFDQQEKIYGPDSPLC